MYGALLLAGLGTMMGCGGNGDDPEPAAIEWEASSRENLRILNATVTSESNGGITLDIPVDAGETAMLVTLDGGTTASWVLTLEDPSGAQVFDSSLWTGSERRTSGVFTAEVQRFNWPIVASDTALSEGTWTLEMAAEAANTPIGVEIALKSDADFTTGSLDVAVFVADAVVANAGYSQDDLTAALAVWETMYAAAGITLNLGDPSTFTAPSALEPPGCPGLDATTCLGGDIYSQLSDELPYRAVRVVLVDSFSGASFSNIAGFAGGVPGPLISSDLSAVALSWTAIAGDDGALDAAEIDVLGQAMAHEAGHFLGLFHPVEQTFSSWDSLSDTALCNEEAACEAALGANLMYPVRLCDGGATACEAEDFADQATLTAEQAAVLHRYVGVD